MKSEIQPQYDTEIHGSTGYRVSHNVLTVNKSQHAQMLMKVYLTWLRQKCSNMQTDRLIDRSVQHLFKVFGVKVLLMWYFHTATLLCKCL